MKQLLFLLLFPCLALAQYQGNSNQKITLGEQTTADGLVWRGVANLDTVTATSKITRANKQDTSAYILLDTVTNLLWHYKIGSNAWTQVGGGVASFSAGTTGLTPSTATTGAVTLGGTLAVASGGTGSATQNFVDLTTTQSVGGVKTFTSAVVGASFRPESSTIPTNGIYLPNTNTLGFSTNSASKMILNADGNLGLGVTPSTWLGFKAIQLAGGAFVGSATQGEFWTNSYFTGAFKYYGNGYATRFACNNGQFEFYSAINNTSGADANLSFTRVLYINNDGDAIFGSGTPSEKLHVVGNARITAVGALGGNSATLYRNSDGVLSTTSSDINKKHNVRPIIYGLSTISQLNPVNFQWNVDESEDIGFIAQDIQNIIPESIETDWDSNLIFKYEKLIPILTKAIQEQQALIKALEQRILNLENK